MTSKNIRLYAKNCIEIRPGVYSASMDTSILSNLKAISLKACTFDNNVYNIFTDGIRKNNDFTFRVLAPIHIVTINEGGFYSAQEIINILIPQIQAILEFHYPGTVFTMGIDSNKGKIYVNNSDGLVIYLSDGGLSRTLGLTSEIIAAEGIQYVFQSFPVLRGLTSVTVSIRSKTPKTILNTVNRAIHTNSLAVIPVDVPFLAQQNYINPDITENILTFNKTEDLTTTTISLRDPDGNILTNQSNSFLIELIGFI